MTARNLRFAGACISVVTTLTGCGFLSHVIDPQHLRQRREACRKAFTACAPPANFDPNSSVDALSTRKLVHASSRLDWPKAVTAPAAARLRAKIAVADLHELEEIDDVVAEQQLTLERCRCKDAVLVSEFERQGVGDLLHIRIAPRQVRSPRYWSEKVVSNLVAIREASRRDAKAAVITADANVDASTPREFLDLEHELCNVVHDARSVLSRESFEAMLNLVYEDRALGGEASVELAKRTVERMLESRSCTLAANR